MECPAKSRRVRVLDLAVVDRLFNKDQGINNVSCEKAICETLLTRLSEVAAGDGFISLFVRLAIDSPIVQTFQGLGATSFLILVGVAIDTSKQVQTYVISQRYEGLVRL